MPDEPSVTPPQTPDGERPNGLSELERRLYSRTPPPLRHDEEYGLSEEHIRIAPGWTEEAERRESSLYGILATVMPWIKRLFVASIIFFLFAGSIALWSFWRGTNTVSPQNISLSVLGPVAVAAGEELSFEVTVANYNELDLDATDLLVEYPNGTRNPANLSADLLRHREALGAIPAGGTISRRLSIIPFGEEGEKQKIKVVVEYRPKDSSGTFPQETEYEFLISAAPISVITSVPTEVASGQTFDLTFTITSNSPSVIRGLLLKAEYPPGFQFVGSAPEVAFSKNLWKLGDLKPEGKATVRLTGRLTAAEEEERTFRFSVGTASPRDEKLFGVVFLTESPSIRIARPLVGVELLLNGTRGEKFVARSGQTIRTDILWSNNLPSRVTDLEITAELDGTIFVPQTVAASGGLYDAAARKIRWTSVQQPRFASVAPGESGTVSFSFSLLPVSADPALFRNPQMALRVSARALRGDTPGTAEAVASSFGTEIKVATALGLLSRLVHSDGPFTNAGPLPPKVGAETTYTIVWSLSNSSNNISAARVKAVLPPYVRWLGEVSPANERVTYNTVGGEVVWEVGELPAPVGFGTPPREVAFQVALLPTENQLGIAPAIIGEAVAEGEDRFTGTVVTSATRPAQGADALTESGAAPGSGVVVP